MTMSATTITAVVWRIIARIVWMVVRVIVRTVTRIITRIVAEAERPERVVTPSPIIAPRTVSPIPIVPRVARIAIPPRRVGRPPTIVPRVGRQGNRRTPRAEHRGNVLRLNPYLVARDHHIIESRIVRRSVVICVRVLVRVVARRQTVRGRLETEQTTRVCALVRIGQHQVVRIEVALVRIYRIIVCRSRSACLGNLRLQGCLTCFGFGAARFGLCLLTLSNLRAVVYLV